MESGGNCLDVFSLLLLNDPDETKKFLSENGKERKVYCPIRFLSDEERGDNNAKDDSSV